MPAVTPAHFEAIREKCHALLARNGHKPEALTLGVQAWDVLHLSGAYAEVCREADYKDAHLQTALQRVFPNAVFKDAKRY